MKRTVKVGTRGSALAIVQADMVIDALEKYGTEAKKIIIKTQGDRNQSTPLENFGGKGVFVDEFEKMLLDGEIDIAVHSAKDMPTSIPDGLEIGVVLKRADARDVLVSLKKTDEIKIIGTSSKRRTAQIKELYPAAECKPLRGNVPTRINKMKNGEYDAVILAKAGLDRLNLMNDEKLKYEILSIEKMTPAACQGIIAIENRKNDFELKKILEQINDKETNNALIVEREIMTALDASCTEAVGAYYENGAVFVMMKIDDKIVRKRYESYNLQKITEDFT